MQYLQHCNSCFHLSQHLPLLTPQWAAVILGGPGGRMFCSPISHHCTCYVKWLFGKRSHLSSSQHPWRELGLKPKLRELAQLRLSILPRVRQVLNVVLTVTGSHSLHFQLPWEPGMGEWWMVSRWNVGIPELHTNYHQNSTLILGILTHSLLGMKLCH